MLFMLLLLPTRMVAETDYDESVTFTALAGDPDGMSEAENFKKLFDGKESNSSKWCCWFSGSAYVIFKASKAGVPVGYTITTGNDNATWGGRNPLSWKLYGNNTGKDDAWVLIDAVENDTKLKDENNTSYEFPCEGSTSYQYFKWEISAIHSGPTLQVGEFKLKLQTCTHKNADNSDALGDVINTIEPTCTEHGYTTHKCSLCNSIVKVYKDDVLKPHKLTHHEAKAATCTEAGNIDYWQCSVCNKLFSDEAATTEITDATSLVIPAKGHTFDREGNCTVCPYKDSRYALFNLEGITDVTITDNDSYPWKMLDLNADGMSNVSSYFTAESKGLMSSNYGANDSRSEIRVKFNVEKPILFSFDLSKFNTKEVKYMNNMFWGCSALSSLDLSNFNTANVMEMGHMFYNCSTLTSLDLSNFNTEKVRYMHSMFNACSALTTIYASDEFVTTKVEIGSDMFSGCTNLKDYDSSKTNHKYANCGTDGYFTPGCAYAEFDNATRTLTFRYKGVKPAGAYDLNVESNNLGWNAQKENIEKVVFDASFANARPTSCYKWFDSCYNLTEIEGIENLNTEKVTNMGSMFSACFYLTSLDVSNFNTQNVEDMSYMFNRCINLTSLDVSNFNTQKVEKMNFMFSCCEGLNSLDLSKFDTQNVTNMSYMFWRSSALTTIYASDKFVTTKVSSGAKMFQGCTNLKGFIDYISNSDKDNYEYANYKTGYFTKLVGKNGEEKIGATGETLTTENLVLDDGKDFVAYEPFAAKNAFYIRVIPEGSTWGTLCLPFAIDQSQETECKFYRLTGIDNDCITLESCEEGKIPAGTPVLFKMNENEQTLSIFVQNAGIVKEPVAETNTDVNLVGSFTKIGGNDNQGLADTDYIIGKDKFWRVSDLDGGNRVGIKPMRAYIHPANEYQARAAMLSIGKGDGTTAIDNLNAISNDANAEYYDVNGRRTNGLQKGLNIVKRGSKTYKIMVK